jgi:hypothetical protein
VYAQEQVPQPKEQLPQPKEQLPMPAPYGAPIEGMPLVSGGGCCGNGAGGCCYPGRTPCCGDIHGFFGGLYHCLCCPDPCYEPTWIPEQNAAFFVDPVRPSTQTRIRVDTGVHYNFPDTAEFFLVETDNGGRGPRPGGPVRTNYGQFALYQEVAPTKRFSFFFELTGLSLYGDGHGGGFGDMNVGTKSVWCDCELFLLAFQFRTYIPTGATSRALGTGHVSLEPSLIASIKLLTSTYLQLQAAEVFPIAGDSGYAAPLFHFHASVNHVLYRFTPDVPLIGTLEFNDYTFQGGQFTVNPGIVDSNGQVVVGAGRASAMGVSVASIGPGLRLSVCNHLDFGLGTAFGMTDHGPRQLYRAEIRWRF